MPQSRCYSKGEGGTVGFGRRGHHLGGWRLCGWESHRLGDRRRGRLRRLRLSLLGHPGSQLRLRYHLPRNLLLSPETCSHLRSSQTVCVTVIGPRNAVSQFNKTLPENLLNPISYFAIDMFPNRHQAPSQTRLQRLPAWCILSDVGWP